jgi:hypothetical protein
MVRIHHKKQKKFFIHFQKERSSESINSEPSESTFRQPSITSNLLSGILSKIMFIKQNK